MLGAQPRLSKSNNVVAAGLLQAQNDVSHLLQELLLILEDHWNRSPDLHHVPIFSASGLASQSLKVYQTYIEMMNDAIKQAFQVNDCARKIGTTGNQPHPVLCDVMGIWLLTEMVPSGLILKPYRALRSSFASAAHTCRVSEARKYVQCLA